MVKNNRTNKGKLSCEVHYYITSLKPDPKKIASVIRTHWGIENSVHWVLDVIFKEDSSQIATGNAAENLSILRRLSLNLLRLDPDKKTSLRAKRKKSGWNDSYLSKILGFASVNSF